MNIESKIIFLYFRKNCTYQEISEILDVPTLFVSQTIAVELCETKRQFFIIDDYVEIEYSGKVKLN